MSLTNCFRAFLFILAILLPFFIVFSIPCKLLLKQTFTKHLNQYIIDPHSLLTQITTFYLVQAKLAVPMLFNIKIIDTPIFKVHNLMLIRRLLSLANLLH